MRNKIKLIIAIILIVFLLFFWVVNYTSMGNDYFSYLKIIPGKKEDTIKLKTDTNFQKTKSLKIFGYNLDLKFEDSYLYINLTINEEISFFGSNFVNDKNKYIKILFLDKDNFLLSETKIYLKDFIIQRVLSGDKLLEGKEFLESMLLNYEWKGNIPFNKNMYERIYSFDVVNNFNEN